MTDQTGTGQTGTSPEAKVNRTPLTAFAWLWVGIPLAYGLYELISKVTQLFTG